MGFGLPSLAGALVETRLPKGRLGRCRKIIERTLLWPLPSTPHLAHNLRMPWQAICNVVTAKCPSQFYLLCSAQCPTPP